MRILIIGLCATLTHELQLLSEVVWISKSKLRKKMNELDSMRWFSHRLWNGEGLRHRGRLPNKTPHFSFFCLQLPWLWPLTLTFGDNFCTAPNRHVSSSYVESFGSYRVKKQTNRQTNKQTAKQTPLKTSLSLHCATPAGKTTQVIRRRSRTFVTCQPLSIHCFRWLIEDSLNEKCGPMPNLMVALSNIGGTLCSTPQSLADAHY